MSRVTIIDYGVGNLRSVAMALSHCGANVSLASSPEEIVAADRVVFPGVGAFANAMNKLDEMGLTQAIKAYAELERPFLGICLGMQMMFDSSDEFGLTAGLGLIPGTVEKIPSHDGAGKLHKVPHIAWAGLLKPQETPTWKDTLFERTPEGTPMYFVHSYAGNPTDSEYRLADCEYNGRIFCAAVGSGNLYGTQFHPEKSGEAGLVLLRQFLA
ncbi:imidazole glycerol phosphate synthase subunit HisH 1 [Pseudodesulfovibrio nedwellii]|uniref:Imidazole glycerol phosphate synthase subunit HisH n=1 Tax=Pseudodesulfovibrio nedwellii TaxID=2973072 RepID=A0ABM8B2N9_9BACT|nr:imidazole glycerol phosphate synthase subunit HisH [Pseudodesulfovibrio nedwellii]BDQ38084.1 imidazole glycerol phosphate synthase subunit HisH 1 [Pseudodesulfovibrio nedwellii]